MVETFRVATALTVAPRGDQTLQALFEALPALRPETVPGLFALGASVARDDDPSEKYTKTRPSGSHLLPKTRLGDQIGVNVVPRMRHESIEVGRASDSFENREATLKSPEWLKVAMLRSVY
jgi:hypothetical protein